MAGSMGNGGVFWNVGDTAGRDDSGAAADLPTSVTAIGAGTATPTAAPLGAPIYRDTDNDDIYIWTGVAWIGPYNKGT